MKGIYLDNSTTARPSQRAISAMLPFYSDLWGTPSVPHQGGNILIATIESSYRTIYRFLGAAEEDTFILTSCGAEAVNQVFNSVYHGVTRKNNKNHFLVCATDEAPALMCVSRLEEFGCVGGMVSPNANGIVTPELIQEQLTPSTALVSLSWGNGLTGTLHPAKEIAALCHANGVLFHLDVTHVLGKMDFDLDEIGANYLTFNAEQFHAPKGVGGVLFRKDVPAYAFIVGGIEQAALRAGSLNVPALVVLAEVSKEGEDHRDYLGTETARLRNKFEDNLQMLVPSAKLFFQNQERLPHISVMAFPGYVNETLLYLLNKKRVMACIGGGSFQQIALVMEACGVSRTLAHSAISFSLSRDTSDADVDDAADIIAAILKQLKPVGLEELC